MLVLTGQIRSTDHKVSPILEHVFIKHKVTDIWTDGQTPRSDRSGGTVRLRRPEIEHRRRQLSRMIMKSRRITSQAGCERRNLSLQTSESRGRAQRSVCGNESIVDRRVVYTHD
jgi:hypothetical protein